VVTGIGTPNVLVEHGNEIQVLNEFLKHAFHMRKSAGYRRDYASSPWQKKNDGPVTSYKFIDEETGKPRFCVYVTIDRGRECDNGEYARSRFGRILQIVVPPTVLENHPEVKKDLEMLCNRVFQDSPGWISQEEAPIKCLDAKPGCLGFLYGS